jgi:UDP-N-acetylmuramoylalanine--D-glutamate ligase
MNLKNKKVLVIGLGESGFAAAQLARAKGAEVFVTESSSNEAIKERSLVLKKNNIEVEINGHTTHFLKGIELVIISPGVSLEEPFVKEKILSRGIPIISEIELAFAFCQSNKLIAVTGTNGKSTTVELIGHLLREDGKKVVVCGNIGRPFSAFVNPRRKFEGNFESGSNNLFSSFRSFHENAAFSEDVEEIDKETFVILEVSSYQLETIREFMPYISVILNITEDHLDRYDSMYDYTLAKMRIFKNQTPKQICILNLDDENTRELLPYIKAKVKFFSLFNQKADCFFKMNQVILRRNGKHIPICQFKDFSFYGSHNIENALASILVTSCFLKEPSDLTKTFATFKPLNHRTQFITKVCGVDFIDDSKATNVDATKRALESLDKKIILICGGRNKKNDFSKIKSSVLSKVKLAIIIGEAREEIACALKGHIKIEFADDLSKATRKAFKKASEGDCVLLSPMCASFDMFRDYRERGECFKRCVLDIERENKCVQKG